ncbi:DUF2470 domain-containing protein [Streptomyces sp. MUM 203J]|uniref:DUF2470 domain-containing protein n=1 Tax=Streptomyces sp. MUM 203J TaxID=2791990 RepID=UPI001F03F170|nr:DUF2470 domain-containing protein [Streptomyces sp. MUM 203J]MCH0540576.1 DUF2470 domain-containing protein [Streptomyces sp. MUM 203J]
MPSAAERTRTLVQSTCSATLLIPGACAPAPDRLPADPLSPEARTVGGDGEILLLYPADSPAVRAATHAQDDELPAELELTDVAPVAVPHRIRARARVRGWLTSQPGLAEPGQMMLRLEVGDLYVDDLWGSGPVDTEAFAGARPDPLRRHEAELLQHLAAAHGDRMLALASLLGRDRARTDPPVRRVVPLALDSFGLRVRCRAAGGGVFDARFDFPEPVREVTRLRRAMQALFDAAEEASGQDPAGRRNREARDG